MSRARLFAVGLGIVFVALGCVNAQAARGGRLTGVVRDQSGAPLVGATIAIFDAMSESEAPVRNAKTDDAGRFTAAVAPGRYLLRAVASGFDVTEARALVAANRETKIDSIALRRVDTLSERRRATADPYRDAILSSRGHILHLDDSPEERRDEATAYTMALTDEASSTHGVVQTVAATGTRAGYVATNFAVAHKALGSDLLVTGQTGVGEGAPQRVEALATTDVGETHRLALGFGYGRLPRQTDPAAVPLGQYTVQATDHWRVAGPVVFVYGLNYTRFSGPSEADAVLPRVGVEFDATPTTQVFARLSPGSDFAEVTKFDLETGEATFAEPEREYLPAERDGALLPDRSRRFEVGVGHLIDERSNVEVMAFFDTASGHGVGFLAIPAEGADGERFSTGELDGRTSGVRVLYTRRLNDVLSGTVGYAAGRGLRFTGDASASPAAFVAPATFQALAARIEADFASGTHVAAVYRFNSNSVVFAIDPFAGRIGTFDPAASIFVSQDIPMFSFIPGQWTATLDVRNVFDARGPMIDEDTTIADFSRLVRAGVSLRF